ncbi:glycosyltransferase [Ruania alba]|uniref:Glycosyl transferase family 2 n=1 Tax=Ruania alba TaxID=648782 RepID=A0A1H5N9D2_9MICO|nr:glycosyltransferase [Ruania alba]SEE98163.1 Glycosyl transferase family 2 [Ruania alba]
MSTPILSIGYSTLAPRAGRISIPPPEPDLEVLACVQGGQAPKLPGHVRALPLPGIGVARSRNAVIAAARGRYLLFCDDDVQVDLTGVRTGIAHLTRTGHAIALGRGVDPSGALRKQYPLHTVPLTRFNSAKAATYEMLIDLDQVRAAGVRFDERFGAGASYHLGDEYIFIADLLSAGLRGEAVPETFGMHPHLSSGSQWSTSRDRDARAIAINRVFGPYALGPRMAFAWKNRHRLGSLANIARFAATTTRVSPNPEQVV